jgi:hypothetical protein
MSIDDRDVWKYTWSGVAWARLAVAVRRLKRDLGEAFAPLVCRFFGHHFAGWKDAGEQPGLPLPTAYCSRCHREL